MNKKILKDGEKIARDSIIHLILLGLIKGVAGLVTGMHVIIADAISTFADVLGVFASYLGLRLSRKSADKKFKYGYYKVETFAAFVVSVGMIYAGYLILSDGFSTMKNPVEGQYRQFAITTTIISIIFSIKLAKTLAIAGKKVNSLSLLANAKDKKIDVFSGFIVLFSIVANYKQIPYVENVVTIMIGLIILKVGVFSTKESLFFLLDYWNDPKLTRKIRKVLRGEKDLVLKVINLKLRRAGTFIFGEAFIEINPYAGIRDLRDELDLLKRKIEDLDPYIKDFSIHTHISKLDHAKVAVPLKKGRSLSAEVAFNLRETNAYLFAEIKKGKIKGFYTKKLSTKDKKPVEFANFLKGEKINILINNSLNSLIYYNLRRTHHVLIYPNFSNIKKVRQTLELLMIDT